MPLSLTIELDRKANPERVAASIRRWLARLPGESLLVWCLSERQAEEVKSSHLGTEVSRIAFAWPEADGEFKPANEIHWENGDVVHLLVMPHREGGWQAKMWSSNCARMRVFKTPQEADWGVRRLFLKQFPRHLCDEYCRSFNIPT